MKAAVRAVPVRLSSVKAIPSRTTRAALKVSATATLDAPPASTNNGTKEKIKIGINGMVPPSTLGQESRAFFYNAMMMAMCAAFL